MAAFPQHGDRVPRARVKRETEKKRQSGGRYIFLMTYPFKSRGIIFTTGQDSYGDLPVFKRGEHRFPSLCGVAMPCCKNTRDQMHVGMTVFGKYLT